MIEHVSLGRSTVDVHQYGNADGFPLVYHHGLPASGMEAKLFEGGSSDGFRIIAPTRPGYAGSRSPHDKSVQEISEDTLRILDRMGVREFCAVGTSGGAQYALNLAHHSQDRAKGIAVVSGLPPLTDAVARRLPANIRTGLLLGKRMPRIADGPLATLVETTLVRPARRNPEPGIEDYRDIQPPPDRRLLENPEIFRTFLDVVRDWSQVGSAAGMVGDARRAAKPWQVDLADVSHPVHVVHGTQDPVVPLSAARAFEAIPGHTHEYLPGRGHTIYADPMITSGLRQRMATLFKKS